MDSRFSICHLFVLLNLYFLHNSQWINIPTESYLALYPLCANLLHSLFFMWLIVSSQSQHYLHMILCCVLSDFALIWSVLIVLLCAAIKRYSVSHLRFPFHCHDEDFSYEISLVCHLKNPYSCFYFHFCFLIIFVLLMFVLSVCFWWL